MNRMGRFLKSEVLIKAITFKKLSSIDPADKKNRNALKAIRPWICCSRYLKESNREISCK